MADAPVYKQNFNNHYFISTGLASEPTMEISEGLKKVEWSGNESLDQSAYYKNQGAQQTDVTGGQLIGKFECDYAEGDDALDFIVGLRFSYGSARHVKFKWEQADGKAIEQADVTLANIDLTTGEANSKQTLTFEVHFNGVPTVASNV